jgi:anti-sigma regulatory factor (Ser/Thr protein kinase)
VRESSVVLLPCAPASVAEARRRITADLLAAGIFDPAIGDAALVLSELLSNAIRHARALPGSTLQVTWQVDGGCVQVAVCDGGSTTRPNPAHPPVSSLGGRGLGIVEHLSRDWGVRRDDLGVTVWAVVPAPRQNGNGAGPLSRRQARRGRRYRPPVARRAW